MNKMDGLSSERMKPVAAQIRVGDKVTLRRWPGVWAEVASVFEARIYSCDGSGKYVAMPYYEVEYPAEMNEARHLGSRYRPEPPERKTRRYGVCETEITDHHGTNFRRG